MNEEKEKREEASPKETRTREKITWEMTPEGMLQEKRVEEPVPEEEVSSPEPELPEPPVSEKLEPEQPEPSVSEKPEPEQPAKPAEAAPAGEEEDPDDAAIWNNLPRPARRRQPRVQATIVPSAPAGERKKSGASGSGQQKSDPKQSNRPEKRKKSASQPRKKRKERKSLLQWIQSLDLRLLVTILIVLIIIALVVGSVLFHLSGAVSAMSGGDSGFSNRGEDGGDDAWNYSQEEDSSDQSLERYDGDSSGVTLELKSSQGLEALTYEALYKKCEPSVVSITVENDDSSGSGTGIVLTEDGYIITCAHVVSGQSTATVTTGDEKEYNALLVGSDPQTDLALLKVEAEGLTPAEFGDAGELTVGDEALAIGDPLGATFRGTLTNGIISAINRDVTLNGYSMTLIQTTAALNSGNSGGPLLNIYGQVVGINNMKMVSSSTTVEGLGFAVPTTTAKEIIEALAKDGGISRPVLGITCYGVDEETAEKKGTRAGLVIAKVNEKSDCAAKGLKAGDLITAIDGKLYTDVADFKEYAADFEIGHKVTLTVYRPRETSENQTADASSSEKSEEPVEYDALGEITVSMVDQQDIS